MKKPNDKDGSEDKKMLCSAKVVEKLCSAFLLIPVLGKTELTLVLMMCQTASVRTRSFIHFILQTKHNSTWDFQKDSNYVGSDSQSRTTQVWLTFYYVVTIALSVITDRVFMHV